MEPSKVQLPFRNRVLASLPASDIMHLMPHLSPRIFKRNQTLHDSGQLIDTVYFLETGICSMVITMQDGNSIEAGIVGREGFVGIPAVLGTDHSVGRSFIQIPGAGYAIDAKILAEKFHNGSSQLRMILQRFIQALLGQVSQTAACNRVHELEERLARWLLMCHDSVQIDNLPITHEFLAMMLGTRRSSVTMALGILHKAGLIEHSRGHVHVKIEDRKGLEAAACECYSVIHGEYTRLGLL